MITMFYLGLCCVLVVVLGARVALWRNAHQVGLGDGGDKELLKRVRAHGNAVENLPLLFLLLGGMELTGYPAWLIHSIGAGILISRLAHAWGLSRRSGRSVGRLTGMALTWLLMLVMAGFAVWGVIGRGWE